MSFWWNSDVCNIEYSAPPNSDLSGIGISVSYIVQALILAVSCVASNIVGACMRRRKPSTLDIAKTTKTRRTGKDQYAALVSGIVGFQKWQTCFAITFLGAALLALSGDGSMFSATMYSQLYNGINMLRNVASTSLLGVVFALYLLHRAGRMSTYVTTLTILAATLCLAVWFVGSGSLPNLAPRMKPETLLPSCGGYVTPAKFCSYANYATSYLDRIFIPIYLVVLIGVLAHQSKHYTCKSWRKLTRLLSPHVTESVARLASYKASWKYRDRVTLCFLALLDMFFLGVLGLDVYMYLLSQFLMFRELRPPANWTFGQLLAVTVWVPPLLDYFRCAVCKSKRCTRPQLRGSWRSTNWVGLTKLLVGVDEAEEHRYIAPFHVVREPAESTPEVSSSGDSIGLFKAPNVVHLDSDLPT
jgi:hypothetical protein